MNSNSSKSRGRNRGVVAVATLLALAACTRAEFGGHVFVVKGGGDVKPAAGERVYLLPYADKDELRSALLEETISSQFAEVAPRLVESCKAGAASLEKELQKNQAELQNLQSTGDISEAGCAALKKAQDGAQTVFDTEADALQKQIEPLRSRLRTLRDAYDQKLAARASALKASAEQGVSVSQKRSSISFLTVTIRNTTEYCVGKPGRVSFEFFQKGINVGADSDYVSSDTDSYGFELGCLVKPNSSRQLSSLVSRPSASSAESKLKKERHDLSTTYEYGDYFVFDKITSSASQSFYEISSQASGNRVTWTAKPVDWNSVAKRNFTSPETTEIEKLEAEIAAKEEEISGLASSKNLEASRAKTEACFASKDQLEQNMMYGESLNEYSNKIGSCKVTEKNMTDTWTALKDFEASVPISFMIPEIALDPYVIEERFSEYLTSKDIQTADVGIDGKYQFKDVPKKKVLLYARYEDNFTEGYWLVPVDLSKAETKDLNNNDLIQGEVAYDLLPIVEKQTLSGKQAIVAACTDGGESRKTCSCLASAFEKNLSAEQMEDVTTAFVSSDGDITAYFDTLTMEQKLAFPAEAMMADLEECSKVD